MTRKDKYPDTTTFHYFNANPHNRYGDDCVIRAICTALEQSWETTVKEMTEVGLKKGFLLNDDNTINEYLKLKGWKRNPQPRKWDNTKYTGKEFCESHIYSTPLNIIANIGGHHIVAIIDGKVNDIWDSTNGCIGNYWTQI